MPEKKTKASDEDDDEIDINDLKGALSSLQYSIELNTEATIAARIEMESTRKEMSGHTEFLQRCVEKALNGKTAIETEEKRAVIEVRKTAGQAAIDLKVTAGKTAISQSKAAHGQKLKDVERWSELQEKLLRYGATVAFGLIAMLLGLDKLGVFG